jgi:serine/threonine protein kinase
LEDLLQNQTLNRAADVKRIGKQLFEALDVLHTTARMTHRDIKPANILVGTDGNIVLADFGHTQETAHQDSAIGSFYLPETEKTPSDKMDVWAAAMVMMEVAVGRQIVLTSNLLMTPRELKRAIHRRAILLSTKQKDSLSALLSKIFVKLAKRPTAAQVLKDPFFTNPDLFSLAPSSFTHAPSSFTQFKGAFSKFFCHHC